MKKTSTASYYGQLINKIDEYIILNAQSSFGVQQLADACCVSKNHLSDVFRSVCKTSLGNYITRRKAERAATLYYYTGLNLDEVAGLTGFATKHSLSKVISNHFEVSPGKLKRASLYSASSPNMIIDGIQSHAKYDHLLKQDLEYSFTIEEFDDAFMVGVPIPIITNGKLDTKQFDEYVNRLYRKNISRPDGRDVFVYPLDSINFGSHSSFRMLCGEIILQAGYQTLKQRHPYSIIIPIPKGKYIGFRIQGNALTKFEHEITYYRENILGMRKDFHLTDFFAFYSYSATTTAHRYLVHYCQ